MHEMVAQHGTEGQMHKTSGCLGHELMRGNVKPCLACTVGKASQKLLSKQRNKKPPSDGSKRIFLDVFALKKRPKDKTVMKNPNWRISCDHESGLQMTEFCLTKDGMVEPTLAKFDRFRQAGIDISHLQMDDAGEKKAQRKRPWLVRGSSTLILNMLDAMRLKGTSKWNGLWQPVAGRSRSVMTIANVPDDKRTLFYKEAVQC